MKKKPTMLKLGCAVAILAAEFVCLIPTIFPSLESASDKQEEGGATGAAAIVWPLCMVSSHFPYAGTGFNKKIKNTISCTWALG